MRELITSSFTDPRGAAADLLRFRLPLGTSLQCLVVLAIVITFVNYMTALAGGPDPVGPARLMVLNPLLIAVVYSIVFIISGFATYYGGRAFKGSGSLEASFLVIVWINAVQVILSFAQLVILSVSPFLGSMLVMAGLVWFFWALTQFVKVLHGFENGVLVLIGIFAMMTFCLFVAAFSAALIMIFFGLVPEEMMRGV